MRKAIGEVEHRSAQLMKSGERQLHLGLDTGRTGDDASVGVPGEVVEQRGLADPGLAADEQHLALSGAEVGNESPQSSKLRTPATKLLIPTTDHRATLLTRG
jgi:hypothetical protein